MTKNWASAQASIAIFTAALGGCVVSMPEEMNIGDAGGITGDATIPSSARDGSVVDSSRSPLPEVVSIVPADGATGVVRDAMIRVQFNVPMDRVATQAAYQSRDLPSGAVTFDWSADSRVLTITPVQPLEYAAGTDPNATEARTYTVRITSTAADVEGNRLAGDKAVTFSTKRSITQTFEAERSRSGTCIGTYGPENDELYRVGDSNENEALSSVFTFDFRTIPTEPGASAELVADQLFTIEGTYDSLGDLMLQAIVSTAIDDPCSSSTVATDIGVFSTTASDGGRALDVTTSTRTRKFDPGLRRSATPLAAPPGLERVTTLPATRRHAERRRILAGTRNELPSTCTSFRAHQDSRASRNDRSQFRLQFATPSNNDGADDLAVWISPRLNVTYEID